KGPQLFPIDLLDAAELEPYDLLPQLTDLPARMVWYCARTSERRTWDPRVQLWSSTLVQLMCEVEDDDFRVVMRKLTGELICKVAMDPATSWK
ncbi:unnamed protein product, partial [Symbiodinium pilosum]